MELSDTSAKDWFATPIWLEHAEVEPSVYGRGLHPEHTHYMSTLLYGSPAPILMRPSQSPAAGNRCTTIIQLNASGHFLVEVERPVS